MTARKQLQVVDEKLKAWGGLLKVALQPIAALFSGDLWEKALKETRLSFKEHDTSGGEAKTLFSSLMKALHARVKEWQEVKLALLREQKKLRSGKNACLSAKDFNKVAGKFQSKNKGLMTNANRVNRDLYKLKQAENEVDVWKKTKMLSLMKRFASKKEEFRKVAKQYKSLSNKM
jgi:hypothetical protein